MKKFTSGQVGEVLQRLRDSEINFELIHFFDQGFDTRLGDRLNGYFDIPESKVNYREIESVVSEIAYYASIHYPKSDFAEWYNSL